MKAADDKPYIEYINMGPWPVYVGCTSDEAAFKREMGRLCPGEDVAWIGHHANATTHYFTKPGELLTIIVAVQPRGRRTINAFAGLIAHECTHIVQEMRDRLISYNSTCREGLGIEAEAYLVQYLVQEMLAIATGSMMRNRVRPVSSKRSK